MKSEIRRSSGNYAENLKPVSVTFVLNFRTIFVFGIERTNFGFISFVREQHIKRSRFLIMLREKLGINIVVITLTKVCE